MSTATDQYLDTTRAEIAALDVRILALLNQRIRKVAEVRRYKDANGVSSVDRELERWLADYLKRINCGPLSDRGVDELIRFVLALVKQEVARG